MMSVQSSLKRFTHDPLDCWHTAGTVVGCVPASAGALEPAPAWPLTAPRVATSVHSAFVLHANGSACFTVASPLSMLSLSRPMT